MQPDRVRSTAVAVTAAAQAVVGLGSQLVVRLVARSGTDYIA